MNFTLDSIEYSEKINLSGFQLGKTNFSETNRNFLNFINHRFDKEISSNSCLSLSNLLEIYDEYLGQHIEDHENTKKNQYDLEIYIKKFEKLEIEKKEIKENLKKLSLDHVIIDKNILKSSVEKNKSIKTLNILEKENKLLKIDLFNTIKSKNSLTESIKNECSVYRELLSDLVNNVKIND